MLTNPQPHNDQKYITALLNNDSVLLNELYHQFYPAIKCMVLQNNGTATDADDLFQEAIIAIYQKAKTGNLLLTNGFGCYLYKVCRNIWITQLSKKNRVFKELSTDINEYVGENSFGMLEECRLQEQRFELFEETFAKLGKRSKELLLLNWSGKSMKEVAQTLNMTHGFSRTSKAKGCKRLATLIKQSPKFSFLKR